MAEELLPETEVPQKKQSPQEDRGLVSYHSRDGQEIKLSIDIVRKFLVSGRPEFVTDQEIMLYMGTCKARGLNPFKKDCYLVKYTQNDPASTIVSIDYFRSRAKAQPDCVGWQCGVIAKNENDLIEYRNGSFMYEGDELVGAWYRAKPKGWDQPYEWSVNLKPYIKKTRDGQTTRFWADENQPQQLTKVVESQGLRRTWPDEFQSLYIAEEITIEDETPKEKVRAPGTAYSYRNDLQGAIEATGRDFKSVLKELTGKTFITNVTETEAKEALAKLAESGVKGAD